MQRALLRYRSNSGLHEVKQVLERSNAFYDHGAGEDRRRSVKDVPEVCLGQRYGMLQ